MIGVITDCEGINSSFPISLISSRLTTQSELLDPLSLPLQQQYHMALIPLSATDEK